MYTSDYIEHLKRAVPLPDVFQELGYEAIDKVGLHLCPFHDDKKPSLSVRENYFHCFSTSCGASGDALTLIVKTTHCKFPAAVKFLEEIYASL